MELHEHRASALKERVAAMNVRVVKGNVAAMEFVEKFNRVLADVPCSGTGTLAANPEIKWRLRADDLGRLKDLQVSILRAAMAALVPGGQLVYSTCSLEQEECEQSFGAVFMRSKRSSVIDCESVLQELKRCGRAGVGQTEDAGAGRVFAYVAGNSSV